MVRKCVICGLTDSAKNNVSFHSFPTNEIYKKKWLDRCNMTQAKKQDKICSRHFNDSSFTTWIGRRSLKKDAIPELFLGKENKYLKRIRKHSLSSSSVQSNLVFPLTSYVDNIIEVQDEVQDEIREQIKSGTQNLSSTTTSITTDISTCITPVLNESTSENEQDKNIVLPLK
ncbi:uncharacterized protein LOC118645538 [Monomorium pharaonis]|uniref:uncharacterized protein LOC118645538 n=1 Tax=Monomorium pharaonis TaxID=307658 RepID=UPI001746FF01|nr:uncharacterized protein LOC118645538 [Monomorium pharaonis]